MHLNRYSYLATFTIVSSLFLASVYAGAKNGQFAPQDNDATYSLPAYVPAHSQNEPHTKIQFNDSPDNDALYSTPVQMPAKRTATPATPKKPTPKPVAKTQPKAPLAPQNVIDPTTNQQDFYQQYYYQPAQPVAPQPQQEPETKEVPEQSYPYYYY